MAKIPTELKKAKERFESTSLNYGVGFADLISLLPTLMGLFSMCKKQPPPNPVASATPAQEKAYQSHWHATTNYLGGKERYRNPIVKRTAKEFLRTKKKNGEPITKDEAVELALSALDEARLNDVDTIAVAIENAGA